MTLLRLCLLAVLLASLTALAGTLTPSGPATTIAARAEAQGPTPEPTPTLDSLAETRDRPLFTPARRPLEVAAPVSAGAGRAQVLGRWTVAGALSQGGKASVLLAPLGGGDLRRLSAGDELEGWTVVRLDLDQLVLRQGSSEQVIRFEQPVRKR